MTPAQSRIKEWRHNPGKFAQDVFRVQLDAWQVEAMDFLGGPERPRRELWLKACTGPGKSALLALIGWQRLLCFGDRGLHPKGAALSGEGYKNLMDNLWAELIKWGSKSDLIKAAWVWNKDRIYCRDHEDTWFLSARSYAKDADAEAIGRSLSGLHSAYPFALLDEIGDMPPTVGQKASQIFTGGVRDGLVAGAGNPTSSTGLLYDVCANPSSYAHVVTITADPDDPRRTPRVDPEHAREQIQKYGRDNPWVQATILGKFPRTGFNTLLGIEEVEEAMNRRLASEAYSYAQRRLGMDIARFGDDATILAPRQGLRCHPLIEMRGARTQEIAARALLAKKNWNWEMAFIDASGGYGGGVEDAMHQAGHSPMAIHGSGKPMDDRFYNQRAECWWHMAEWVKRGGWLPQDPQLKKELITPTYSLKDGKLIIEPKEQIKKRLGFSPDRADALSLTFSLPDMPAKMQLDGISLQALGAGPQVQHEWNPFQSS